jgi:hypothetical protein
MEKIRIEKFSVNTRKVNKYKNIIDDILFVGENKLKKRGNFVESKKKKVDVVVCNNRWKFKSCPKCHGDLNSCYSEDFVCFQCGYIEYSWNRNVKGGFNGKTEN